PRARVLSQAGLTTVVVADRTLTSPSQTFRQQIESQSLTASMRDSRIESCDRSFRGGGHRLRHRDKRRNSNAPPPAPDSSADRDRSRMSPDFRRGRRKSIRASQDASALPNSRPEPSHNR